MKLFIENIAENARTIMRQLGYGEITKWSGQISFVRRLSSNDFPRFHAYVEKNKGNFVINLHLDAKAPTYGEGTAHSGEYGGELVEEEVKRVREIIDVYKKDYKGSKTELGFEKKKGFWKRLFG